MSDQAATYVFRNARVYTVDPSRAWATAVAVEGNRIAYVGDDGGAAGFIGPDTEVIDLAEAMVLPGFVQGHVHCVAGPSPTGVTSPQDTRPVHASVLRIDVDGDAERYAAAMLDPYADRPDYSGEPLLPPDLLTDIVVRADAEHTDLHFHVTGDRGVRIILDALDRAGRVNPAWDRRHTLCHLSNVDSADIPRFAELSAIARFSMHSAVADPYRKKVAAARLGPQRLARCHPARSILRAGGRVTFGAGWPTAGDHSNYRALEAIEIAITRREPGRPDQQPLGSAEQRFTLGEAIRAHTIDAAYQLRLNDRVGSITTGKLADLVVLGDNLFDIEPTSIHRVPALATMTDGRFSHRENFA